MAKPSYVILSDTPYQGAYAQYTYASDSMEFWESTGLDTIGETDDLYATYQSNFVGASNYFTPFDEFNGPFQDSATTIEFEVYYMLIADFNQGAYYTTNWTQELYIVEGNYDELVASISNYSDLSNWLGSKPAFFSAVDNFDQQTLAGECAGFAYCNSCPSFFTTSGWYDINTCPVSDGWTLHDQTEGYCSNNPANIGIGESNWSNFSVSNSWSDYITSDNSDLLIIWHGKNISTDVSANNMVDQDVLGIYRISKDDIYDAWQSGEELELDLCMDTVYATGYTEACGGDYFRDENNAVVNTYLALGTDMTCSGNTRPRMRAHIRPPYSEVFEVPPYQPFYNMGGTTFENYMNEEYMIYGVPTLGGYNIYFCQELFLGYPTPYGHPYHPDYIYNNWRPISNVFIGNNVDTGTYLQRYYDVTSNEYLDSSAPNIVNFYVTIHNGSGQTYDIIEMNGTEYYQKVLDHYQNLGGGDITVEDLISSCEGQSQKLKFFVLNWNWKEGDPELDEITLPYDNEELNQYYSQNEMIVSDVYDIDGNNIFLQNQYNSPGLKIIKAGVFSIIKNSVGEEFVSSMKSITVRINLGLDDVYIEDFSDIGGADFRFIPWPITSPVIGGLSDDSDYVNSMQSVVDNNLFDDGEVIDKNFAHKAINNDQLGNYFGKSDIEQVRLFSTGSIDMARLLGIEEYYANVETSTTYQFYPYYKFTGMGRWDGVMNKYPEETSVGQIFITENEDLELKTKCLVELNFGETDGRTVRDTSGNGNKGILIGDFSVKKEDKNIPLRRDSVMKTPKKGKENGAM